MLMHYCDGCGVALPKGALRYSLRIEARAAYDELEVTLADLVRDHRAEMLALIERMKGKDPSELEEQVYKRFELDLCPACHRAYIRAPLRFHPEQTRKAPSVDIDAFLRSLGLGGRGDAPPDAP